MVRRDDAVYGRAMRIRRFVVGALVGLGVAAPAAHGAVITAVGGLQSATNGVVVGPGGDLWAAEEFSDSVVRISPTGQVLGRFAVGQDPTSLTTGPGGRVWVAVTGADKLVWFDAASAAPTAHDVPLGSACGPAGIVAGGDGRMYVSSPSDGVCGASEVAAVPDTGTGAVTRLTGRGTAYDLEVAGGKLFVPDFDGNVVRRLALPSMAIEATFPAPAGSGPSGIALGPDGALWVTLQVSAQVARVGAAAASGVALGVVPLPGAGLTSPFGLTATGDGRMAVIDPAAGLVRVTPGTGASSVLALQGSPLQAARGAAGDDLWVSDQNVARVLHVVDGAPRPTTSGATAAGPTSLSASAQVDPRGNATQVVLEAIGAGTSAPVAVPAGIGAVPVTATIDGLTPGTTYRVRVRATNAAGEATGSEVEATTAAALPAAVPPSGAPGTGGSPVPVSGTAARVRPRSVQLTPVLRRSGRRATVTAKGRVVLPAGAAPSRCRGARVTLTLRRGTRRLTQRTVTVSATCTFSATLRTTAAKAHGRLKVTAALARSTGLEARSATAAVRRR